MYKIKCAIFFRVHVMKLIERERLQNYLEQLSFTFVSNLRVFCYKIIVHSYLKLVINLYNYCLTILR